MALLSRKRILLAKIETTYGTDAVPTGAANAILVRNLDVTPLEADLVNRDLVRPYYGNVDQLTAGQRVVLTFEVELQGAGTAGSAAPYGPLLRACGFSETLNASAVTGSAQAGAASAITLAAGASAVDNAYSGMQISITSGTGVGSTGVIVAYNGTTKVATVAVPWATAPAATSGYSIAACAAYKPVSSSFESVSVYFQPQDTVAANSPLHRITGARGNAEFTMTAKQIPVVKFTMTGIYNAPSDSANISATYTSFKTPLPVNKANTPVFNLFGFSAVANELSVNLNNNIVYRNLVNSESIMLTDRKASGKAVFEAPTITIKDFFSQAMGSTLGGIQISHGTVAGSSIDIASGNVDVTTPGYNDMDGIVMMELGVTFIPTTAGNDELFLCVR